MLVTAVLFLAVSIFVPMGVPVRTDCFRNASGGVPSNVSGAELFRTDKSLEVTVWRRLRTGEHPRACGQAMPPESMFANGGEALEVALAPSADEQSSYFHFIANPSNVLYQAKGRDSSWRSDPPVTSRPFFEENRWGVRFSFPYASFSRFAPSDGDCWRANFAAGGCNWTGTSDFHDVSGLGVIEFGGRGPTAILEAANMDEDGTLRVTFAIPRRRLEGEIPHKSVKNRYDLSLLDGGKEVSAFRSQELQNDANYLTLDRYYYPASESLRMEYSALDFGCVSVRVRRLSDNLLMYAQDGLAPKGHLLLPPLSEADYAFEVDDGVVRSSCQFEVRDFNKPLADAMFRYPVVGSEKIVSDTLSFDNAIPKKLVQSPVVGYAFDRSLPIFGAEKRLVKKRADDKTVYRIAYEAQLAVLVGNGSGDSLEPVRDGALFYLEAYSALKRKFPKHKFSIHLDGPFRAAEYARACDVFEYAAPKCSYAQDLLVNLRSSIADMLRFADGRDALFWLGVSIPDNGRSRTAEELNAAVRYCVLRGAAGNVFHLGHGGIAPSNTRLWSYMKGAERAINIWFPLWAQGRELKIVAEAEAGVEYGVREKDGQGVLLAVNFCRYERTLSFVDPVTRVQRILRLPGYGSVCCQLVVKE